MYTIEIMKIFRLNKNHSRCHKERVFNNNGTYLNRSVYLYTIGIHIDRHAPRTYYTMHLKRLRINALAHIYDVIEYNIFF